MEVDSIAAISCAGRTDVPSRDRALATARRVARPNNRDFVEQFGSPHGALRSFGSLVPPNLWQIISDSDENLVKRR
jgi:hypothetical protein